MEFSSNEILKLIERVSALPDFLSRKTDIEILLGKCQTIEEYSADYIGLHPIGHLGKPEDIAYAYLYLASDESSFVTGTTLMVDGGYTAQ